MRYLFASALLLLFYAIVGCLTYHSGQIPAAALARPVDPARPAASAPALQTVALPPEDLPGPIRSTSLNLAPENPPVSMPTTPWHPTKKIGVRGGEDGKSSTENNFRHPLSTF